MNKQQARHAREALIEAVKKAGGPKALGKLLGISGPAISQWQLCPPRRVPELSKISGVPRHRLRPDLYVAE